jgi:hypothetical protein
MGWEIRRGKRYYYRTERVNGRVVKTYVGTGPAAEEAARADAEEPTLRAEKRLARLIAANELGRECAYFAALDEFGAFLCDLMAAEMYGPGYHKVRGVWRKKYKKRAKTRPENGAASP